MSRIKSICDKGSPCHNPLELLKKPEGLPLIKTYKRTTHFSPTLILSNKYSKQSYLT
jgi:hypothetical protein